MIRFIFLFALTFIFPGLSWAGNWNNTSSKEEKLQIKEAALAWSNNLTAVQNYNSPYLKGINASQWTKINEIGDPLKCEVRVKNLSDLTFGNEINPDDLSNNPNAIQDSLNSNQTTILRPGIYTLPYGLRMKSGSNLIGKGNVLLDASNVDVAVALIGNNNLSNVRIHKAKQIGVDVIGSNSLITQTIVSNTGVGSSNNSHGHGFHSYHSTSHSNCLVSVEAFNGYNDISNSGKKGGNADGFSIKFFSHNFTFIDAHAHHNTDDGFDFWKAGFDSKSNANTSNIRIFYSTANFNGKHPFEKNGDGNGFKMGSKDKYQRPKVDEGKREIYGSASCHNLARGFDRNGTKMIIDAINLNAKGNGKGNYQDIRFKGQKDSYKLKCSMFPK